MEIEIQYAIDQLEEMKKVWAGHPCFTCENECSMGEPSKEFTRHLIRMFDCEQKDISSAKRILGSLEEVTIRDICGAFGSWVTCYMSKFPIFEQIIGVVISHLLNGAESRLSQEQLENTLAYVLKNSLGK